MDESSKKDANAPKKREIVMRKLVALICATMAFPTLVFADDVKLDVQHFWQDDACWCGVAAAEILEQYVKGDDWAYRDDRQSTLAELSGKVGTYQGAGADPICGPLGGMDHNDMLDQLVRRLGNGYSYRSNAISNGMSANLHGEFLRMVDGVNQPVIVNGHTRYADGSKALNQHWYVVIGYRDADNNSNTLDPDNDGYFVHDPAHNSPAAGRLNTLSPGKFVSHRNFVSLLTESNGRVHWFKR